MAFEHQVDSKWKSATATPEDSENRNSSFDCNICFDFASDPVVTLCGHLYCWPCIYKWFHVQSAMLPSDEYPQCPVCKAEVSHTTVIPLYGRGQSRTEHECEPKAAFRDMVIPPRPPACGTRALLTAAAQSNHRLPPYRNSYQQPYVQPYNEPEEAVSSSPLFNQTGNGFANVFDIVYALVFGNSHSPYRYPNSYYLVGSNGTRLRRQEIQIDKSLSRISLFLLCCFLLCLLLF